MAQLIQLNGGLWQEEYADGTDRTGAPHHAGGAVREAEVGQENA